MRLRYDDKWVALIHSNEAVIMNSREQRLYLNAQDMDNQLGLSPGLLRISLRYQKKNPLGDDPMILLLLGYLLLGY